MAVNQGWRYLESDVEEQKQEFYRLLARRDEYIKILVDEIHANTEAFVGGRLGHLRQIAAENERRWAASNGTAVTT